MQTIALLVGLALGSPADAPECRNPPSRVSDSYWDYVEACGCAKFDPPSKASQDYDRFLKACSQWRQRNLQLNVIIPNTPPAASTGPTAETSPAPTPSPSAKAKPSP